MANRGRIPDDLGSGTPSNRTTGSRSNLGQLTEVLTELRRTAAALEEGVAVLAGLPQQMTASVQPATAAVGTRHLVYVHGICRHDAGYSDPWWDALHPFTDAFGAGDRGDTRQEVLWSDLVNGTNMAAAATRQTGGASAEWGARVRGVLEERSAALAQEAGPSVLDPELTTDLLTRNIGARNLA